MPVRNSIKLRYSLHSQLWSLQLPMRSLTHLSSSFVDTTSCRCQCKQNVDCAPQYYFNTVTCGCVPCLSGMICASTTGSGTAALPWFHPQHNHLNQYMPLLLKWIFSFLYILSCRNEENEFWILIHWYNMINAKLNSNLKWWILILFLMNDNVDKNILNNECSD